MKRAISQTIKYDRFSITLPMDVSEAVAIRAASGKYAGNRSGYIRDMILRDPLISIVSVGTKTIQSRLSPGRERNKEMRHGGK